MSRASLCGSLEMTAAEMLDSNTLRHEQRARIRLDWLFVAMEAKTGSWKSECNCQSCFVLVFCLFDKLDIFSFWDLKMKPESEVRCEPQ